VVLGVCWEKLPGKGVFIYFGGGELETTDLGSGMGTYSSVGEKWVRAHLLPGRLQCGHTGAFHSYGAVLCEGSL
jgi:hypothetical protein